MEIIYINQIPIIHWLSLQLKNDGSYELTIWHSGFANALDVQESVRKNFPKYKGVKNGEHECW